MSAQLVLVVIVTGETRSATLLFVQDIARASRHVDARTAKLEAGGHVAVNFATSTLGGGRTRTRLREFARTTYLEEKLLVRTRR